MSLLTIISDASALTGLGTVTSAMTNSDLNVQQLVALAQQEGDELSRFTDWRGLKTPGTITGDGTSTVFNLPSDFDRFLAGQTMWLQDSPSVPLIGPVTDQDMLALQVALATPFRPVWRLVEGQVEFYPALQSGQIVQTEYYSTDWITSSDGLTTRTRWAADTDVTRIPERLIALGVVWRWKSAKGFDYAEAFRTYQIERAKAQSKQAGQGVIRQRMTFGGKNGVSDFRITGGGTFTLGDSYLG